MHVYALDAAMLEMLDLSREDQNGTEDTASKYIAAEGQEVNILRSSIPR